MKLELIKASKNTSSPKILERYREYREVSMRFINERIMKKFTRKEIQTCGKKLGIYRKHVFIIYDDEEMAMFMDYMLCHYYINGKNIIEHFLEQKPKVTELEFTLLTAIQQANFGIFNVIEPLPYGGVLVENILTQQQDLLIDVGFSQTANPGFILACNYIRFDEFIMTTGATFPVGMALRIIEEFLYKITEYDSYEDMPSKSKLTFITRLYKHSFQVGATDYIVHF